MTKKRPKDGDLVLHCGHLGAPSWHWWELPNGMPFRRPDGTMGSADWIIGCSPCATAAGLDGLKIQVRGDARWLGNEPVIHGVN